MVFYDTIIHYIVLILLFPIMSVSVVTHKFFWQPTSVTLSLNDTGARVCPYGNTEFENNVPLKQQG
jgi:hypothetical protein